MKVLALVHGLAPEFVGGVERYVEGLSRRLIERGHSVVVVAGTAQVEPRTRLRRLDRGEIPVYRLHRHERHVDHWFASDSPEAARLLGRFIRDQAPDVVHVHHWKRLTRRAVRESAAAAVPAVVTLHDLWSTCPRTNRLKGPLGDEFCELPLSTSDCAPCAYRLDWQSESEARREIALYRHDLRAELLSAARVVSPTRAHRDFACRMLGLDSNAVGVLPIAAPERLSRPEGPPPRRFPETPLRLVHWGHLDVLKGVHVLLEGVRSLTVEERARIEVHVYGRAVTGDYDRRLRELASGLSVSFHGPFDPKELNARRFDLAVFPSIAFESHSIVLDEAFDLGIPVAASDRGALGERAGAGGLLFRAGSPEALAERIREVLARPGILDDLRARLPRPGSMSDHVAEIERLYEAAAAAGVPDAAAAFGDRRDAGANDRHRARSLEERNHAIESLRLKAMRLTPILEDLDRHRALRTELEAEIFEQRRVIETLEADLRGHRTALADAREDLERHRAALKDRDAEIGHRQAALDGLGAELEAVRAAVAAIDADLRRHRDALARAHADLEKLRSAIRDREEESLRLAAHRDDVVTELRAVHVDRDQLVAELSLLRDAASSASADAERVVGHEQNGIALPSRLGGAVRAVASELEKERERARALEGELTRLKHASLPERLRRLITGFWSDGGGAGDGR